MATASPPLVLVVEDQSLIALDFETQLLSAGYRVAVAVTPEAALRATAAELPAVAVVDLTLGEHLDGVALAEALSHKGVQLVIVSGHSAAALTEAKDALPSAVWLEKPILSGPLVGAVKRALASSAAA